MSIYNLSAFLWIAIVLVSCSTSKSRFPSAEQAPLFLEIARDENGKIDYMTRNEAEAYCRIQEAHLPTARELAHLPMIFGARGIVESCGGDPKCEKVSNIKNRYGGKDEFYFSSYGYKRPLADYDGNQFWSSSYIGGDSFIDGTSKPLVFYGSFGSIAFTSSNRTYKAVRCVADR